MREGSARGGRDTDQPPDMRLRQDVFRCASPGQACTALESCPRSQRESSLRANLGRSCRNQTAICRLAAAGPNGGEARQRGVLGCVEDDAKCSAESAASKGSDHVFRPVTPGDASERPTVTAVPSSSPSPAVTPTVLRGQRRRPGQLHVEPVRAAQDDRAILPRPRVERISKAAASRMPGACANASPSMPSPHGTPPTSPVPSAHCPTVPSQASFSGILDIEALGHPARQRRIPRGTQPMAYEATDLLRCLHDPSRRLPAPLRRQPLPGALPRMTQTKCRPSLRCMPSPRNRNLPGCRQSGRCPGATAESGRCPGRTSSWPATGKPRCRKRVTARTG